jgi:hypothetical protein
LKNVEPSRRFIPERDMKEENAGKKVDHKAMIQNRVPEDKAV